MTDEPKQDKVNLDRTDLSQKWQRMTSTLVVTAEIWQFFAFVFAALVTLALMLVDEFMSAGYRRAAVKVGLFLLLGYLTLWTRRGRELLIRCLPRIKTITERLP